MEISLVCNTFTAEPGVKEIGISSLVGLVGISKLSPSGDVIGLRQDCTELHIHSLKNVYAIFSDLYFKGGLYVEYN